MCIVPVLGTSAQNFIDSLIQVYDHASIEEKRIMDITMTKLENEWKRTGIVPNSNSHNERTQRTIKEIQKLNNDLRAKANETVLQEFKNDINRLLSLEESNFKTTVNIYLMKLACFELIRKDEDDYKVIQKEKEIANLKQELSSIRVEINDLITSLKYQYI